MREETQQEPMYHVFRITVEHIGGSDDDIVSKTVLVEERVPYRATVGPRTVLLANADTAICAVIDKRAREVDKSRRLP